jgi:hypothetical protein
MPWMPPVSSVSIELTEADIPRAFIVIDPSHTEGDDVDVATPSSLTRLKTWLDKAQSFAENPASRATLTVELTNPHGGQEQNIVLTDWLVLIAGMTGVSSTGQFALEIQLQHPTGLLDRSSANLGNVAGGVNWGNTAYTDVVDGFKRAYVAWSKAERVPPTPLEVTCLAVPPGLTAVYRAARAALEARADEISTYLKWNTEWPNNTPMYSGLPFGDTCLKAVKNCLGYALTSYVTASGQASIWSAFATLFCPAWMVTIIPTYWRDPPALQVVPFSPWAHPAITIYEDEISDIDFPGVDAAPIGGVRVPIMPGHSCTDYTFFVCQRETRTQEASLEVMYLPELAMRSQPIGRVIESFIPDWITSTMQCDAGIAAGDTRRNNADGFFVTGENITAGASHPVGGESLAPTTSYVGAIYGIAHQLFLSYYRLQVEASFATPLLFKAKGSGWDNVGDGNGGFVVPGCVVRIKTRSSTAEDGSAVPEQVLFDMYLTKVVHTLSADQRVAYTHWSGDHCRKEVGIPDVAKNGDYNPMYLYR